jgi:hypothetical protein
MLFAEHARRVQLAVMPGTLDELHHQNLQSLAHGPECGAERRGRLSLSRPRMNDNQAFARFSQVYLTPGRRASADRETPAES